MTVLRNATVHGKLDYGRWLERKTLQRECAEYAYVVLMCQDYFYADVNGDGSTLHLACLICMILMFV